MRAVSQILAEPGEPLPMAAARELAPHFAQELSAVRVHRGSRARDVAASVGARAFTVANHIVLGKDRIEATAPEDKALLAHELAHSVQQRAAWHGASPLRPTRTASAAAESEAHAAAQGAARGQRAVSLAAHGVSLARQVGPDDLIDPFAEDELLTPEETAAIVASLRARLLEPLARSDGMAFLRQLRALTYSERILMEGDAEVQRRLRERFRGRLLWSLLCTLRFGPTSPVYVRMLNAAVFSRDVEQTLRVLRGFAELRSTVTPDIAPMLQEEFRDSPARAEILRVATQPASSSNMATDSYREVHYETPDAGGAQVLETFGGTAHYRLERTASELRVVVRIWFVRGEETPLLPFIPTEEETRRYGRITDRWMEGILRAWNGRFRVNNGTTQLALVFVPLFVPDGPRDQTVHVMVPPGRADQSHWYMDDSATTAAHEFGHMLGNADEYRVPGTLAEAMAAGLSREDALRSSVEGIRGTARPQRVGGYDIADSIMNEGSLPAQVRHVSRIVDNYNRLGKPAAEANYRAEVV